MAESRLKPSSACSRACVCHLFPYWTFDYLLCAAPTPGSTLSSKRQSPAIIHIAPALVPSAGLTCLCLGCSGEGLTWAYEQAEGQACLARFSVFTLHGYAITLMVPKEPHLPISTPLCSFLPPWLGVCLWDSLWSVGHQQMWWKQELESACVLSLALLEHCHLVDKTGVDWGWETKPTVATPPGPGIPAEA